MSSRVVVFSLNKLNFAEASMHERRANRCFDFLNQNLNLLSDKDIARVKEVCDDVASYEKELMDNAKLNDVKLKIVNINLIISVIALIFCLFYQPILALFPLVFMFGIGLFSVASHNTLLEYQTISNYGTVMRIKADTFERMTKKIKEGKND